jgi:hypothetical protein
MLRTLVVLLLLGAMGYIAWRFLIAGGDPRPADAPGAPPIVSPAVPSP